MVLLGNRPLIAQVFQVFLFIIADRKWCLIYLLQFGFLLYSSQGSFHDLELTEVFGLFIFVIYVAWVVFAIPKPRYLT